MPEPQLNPADVLQVAIFEAAPNDMFSEAQRANVRFLRFSHPVPCAECGKHTRKHWTMLYSFKALRMAFVIPAESGKIHPPLTPVCDDHPTALAELFYPTVANDPMLEDEEEDEEEEEDPDA